MAEILNVPVLELLCTHPIVINVTHGESDMSNFRSQNNHYIPFELFIKFSEQIEARITELSQSHHRFMDIIEGLVKDKES